jgi:penicillin amidase
MMPLPSMLAMVRLAGRFAWSSWRAPRAVSTADRLDAIAGLELPVEQSVAIHWNQYQVPYIEARSDRDLAVGLGVVHAHLRLFQIDMMRRIAKGTLSELFGHLALELDRSLRIVGFARPVEEIERALPEATRDWLEGFVDGINAVIAQARGVPPEYAAIGVEPVRWMVRDVLAIGRLASSDFSWVVWRRLLPLSTRSDWPAIWRRLVAQESDALPSFAGTAGGFEQAFALIHRGGSNALAVAAKRSASGGAMIASDPHLGISLPNLWLIAGMRSPSYQAVGLMIPGLPLVAVGRNPWIAWGGTNLHAASSDLFDVSEVPADQIETRTETIAVRWGGSRAVKVRETRFGPIISDASLLALPRARHLALRWIGHRPNDEITAMLRVARARNWQEFRDALDGFAAPAQTMIYADVQGRVGQAMAAHLPRRPAAAPPDIVSAADADRHWDQVLCARDLPARIDPPEGFVASANNRPEPSAVPIGWFFSSSDRVERIRALIGKKERVTLDNLSALQRDVTIPSASTLRDRIVERVADPDALAAGARAVFDALAGWDGSHREDSAGALALELIVHHLLHALHDDSQIAVYRASWDPWALLRQDLAQADPARLQPALKRALDGAGDDFRRHRRWGEVHRLQLSHIFGRVPWLGHAWRLIDDPVGGGNDSVMKTAHGIAHTRHRAYLGAVARHISDLADPDANHFVLLGGQDGWLGSANVIDQYALWRRGEYIRVPLDPGVARSTFGRTMTFEPAVASKSPLAAE